MSKWLVLVPIILIALSIGASIMVGGGPFGVPEHTFAAASVCFEREDEQMIVSSLEAIAHDGRLSERRGDINVHSIHRIGIEWFGSDDIAISLNSLPNGQLDMDIHSRNPNARWHEVWHNLLDRLKTRVGDKVRVIECAPRQVCDCS